MKVKVVNFVYAQGTRAEIRKLKKAARGTRYSRDSRTSPYVDCDPFTLDALFPIPAALIFSDRLGYPDNMKDGIDLRVYYQTGFFKLDDWLEQNWGMIEDVFDVSVSEGDMNNWMIQFSSWDQPATCAIQRLARLFPKIKFNHSYLAVGSPMSGNAVYHNGYSLGNIKNGQLQCQEAVAILQKHKISMCEQLGDILLQGDSSSPPLSAQ